MISNRITEHTFSVVTQSLTTQVHFKKQVQEWKNILIRGYQAELYAQYLDQFQREEQLTQQSINRLLELLEPGTVSWNAAHDFQQAHETFGRQYRNTLNANRNITGNTHTDIDRDVRGIDRQPTKLMDQVVDAAINYKAARLEQIAQQQSEVEQGTLFAVIGLLTLTVITLVWFADRLIARPIAEATQVARRISRGDLNSVIPARGDDEAGELLQALKSMQESVTISQGRLKQEQSPLAERVERRTRRWEPVYRNTALVQR